MAYGNNAVTYDNNAVTYGNNAVTYCTIADASGDIGAFAYAEEPVTFLAVTVAFVVEQLLATFLKQLLQRQYFGGE